MDPVDQNDPTARVARLLLDQSIVTSVRLAFERVLASRNNYSPLIRKWPFDQAELSLAVIRAVAAACETDGAIRAIFRKRVMPRLACPHLVTEDDVCDAFIATVRTEMAGFDTAYALFVGRVVAQIERVALEYHLTFCLHEDFTLGAYERQDESEAESEDMPPQPSIHVDYQAERERLADIEDLEPLWSRNGVGLKLDLDMSSRQAEGSRLRRLSLRVQGAMTGRALEEFGESLADCAEVVAACIDPVPETLDPTALSIADIIAQREVIGELFDCVVLSSDQLATRIKTAIWLLAEAAEQDNSAISLALAVTALESLLGGRKDNIAKSLAENVAILLEARLEHRRAAEKFVEELYSHRSRVLHGDDLGSRDEAYRRARFLALRVIYNIVNWRILLRKSLDQVLSHEDLLRKLKEQKYSRSPFTGRPEADDVAVFLWAPHTKRST
jgi:hypothetical protein